MAIPHPVELPSTSDHHNFRDPCVQIKETPNPPVSRFSPIFGTALRLFEITCICKPTGTVFALNHGAYNHRVQYVLTDTLFHH